MKIVFGLATLVMTTCIQAQTFQEFIQKGDKLYDEEQYRESAEAYDQAFKLESGSATEYYNAACSWALTGDTIQSIKYLHLSADKGWNNLNHIKSDSDLSGLHSVKEWQEILQKVEANLEEYEKDFDKPLKSKLENIYVKDQMLRQLYQDAEEKFGRDSDEMNYFWQLVSEQDRENEKEVIAILEERGWVGRSLVGGKANMTLWLVIQHAPLETQEKYLPMLRESVMKGESQGSHLALLEDRIQMRNGEPQTYGSQITTDPETGEQIVYEVKDPEYVNQRRSEVGLGPIEDYVRRFGLEWKVEQKEKK